MEEITNDDLDVFLIQIRKKLNQDKEKESHAPAFVRRNSGLGFTLGLPAEFDVADSGRNLLVRKTFFPYLGE